MKRGFIDPVIYPELRPLIDNVEKIRTEVRNVHQWFQWPSDAKDEKGMCSFLEGKWTIFPLYFPRVEVKAIKIPGLFQLELEQLLQDIPSHMPETFALLKSLPLLKFSALSRLGPQSSLAPHRHNNPGSYIAHVGLEIPPGKSCGLKVASSVHHWQKAGDLALFDDNFLHSAWNHSDQERLVLYLDLLRP
jgi:aspartyl/asparaginyl beta-hydroxylase (cupin superfamily)